MPKGGIQRQRRDAALVKLYRRVHNESPAAVSSYIRHGLNRLAWAEARMAVASSYPINSSRSDFDVSHSDCLKETLMHDNPMV